MMLKTELEVAAMEVSSHSMDYRLTFGLRYGVAGFTNLTQDHLDLHGTMEAYFQAKALLFQQEHSMLQVITLNGGAEPHWGQQLAAQTPGPSPLTLGQQP